MSTGCRWRNERTATGVVARRAAALVAMLLAAAVMATLLAGCGDQALTVPLSREGSTGAGIDADDTGSAADGRIRLRVFLDSIGRHGAVSKALAEEYMRQHPDTYVEVIATSVDTSVRLGQTMQLLGARNTGIDVFMIDVIWSGLLDEHFLDLRPALASELNDFFPSTVASNSVGSKLVAAPMYGDVPVLYYRTDVLRRAGVAEPPQTWDELTSVAEACQRAERAHLAATSTSAAAAAFTGYVFQGAARESLVCNALEWQMAEGGGSIIEPDGRISVSNERAAASIARASAWVGGISAPVVLQWTEEDCRMNFQAGNAAFMRNWTYAWPLLRAPGSPVRDTVAVAPLPAGPAGMRAATLGGWQLAVSAYSRHPQEAVELVKFLTSREAQRRRALEGSFLPTRRSLYSAAETSVTTELPLGPSLGDVFQSAVVRPSAVTGGKYNEVSSTYGQQVHRALEGKTSATAALQQAQSALKEILQR